MKLAFNLSVDGIDFNDFREIYFSEEFNQMTLGAAKLRERRLEHFEVMPDGRELRRVRMVPDVSLPGPVQKVVGNQEIAYSEVSHFDPRTRRAAIHVESPAGERLRVKGEAQFTETGSGVEMAFDGDVRVQIFGLGTVIEKLVVSQVKQRYSAVGSELQRYVSTTRKPA